MLISTCGKECPTSYYRKSVRSKYFFSQQWRVPTDAVHVQASETGLLFFLLYQLTVIGNITPQNLHCLTWQDKRHLMWKIHVLSLLMFTIFNILHLINIYRKNRLLPCMKTLFSHL